MNEQKLGALVEALRNKTSIERVDRREVVEALLPLVDTWLAEAEQRVTDAVEAALRLIAPDHITPMGARQVRAAMGTQVIATMPRSECRCPDDCDCDGRFACEARVAGTTHVCELAVSHDGSHRDQNHRWNQETSA